MLECGNVLNRYGRFLWVLHDGFVNVLGVNEEDILTIERLLTVPEVAQRVRVSPATVRDWLRQGKLKGTRPGGTKVGWRVAEAEVDRFLAAGMPAETHAIG